MVKKQRINLPFNSQVTPPQTDVCFFKLFFSSYQWKQSQNSQHIIDLLAQLRHKKQKYAWQAHSLNIEHACWIYLNICDTSKISDQYPQVAWLHFMIWLPRIAEESLRSEPTENILSLGSVQFSRWLVATDDFLKITCHWFKVKLKSTYV